MNKKKNSAVGIDVSKETFNAHWPENDKKYANSRKGWKQLLQEAPFGSLFAMEATGNYHYRLAAFLHSQGCSVAVFNPYKVRNFANSEEGGKTKTDKIDARTVFKFAVHRQIKNDFRLWEPLPLKHARARVVLSLLRGLSKLERAALNMNDAAALVASKSDNVLEPMRMVADACSAHQDSLENELCRLAKELWPLSFRLLCTINSIGGKTAAALLVACKGLESFSDFRKLSSFAGLIPSSKESGTSVRSTGKIKKTGNSYLRALLYMCAQNASRYNEPCAKFYSRLVARGKSKQLALVAVMHKLVKIAFAVVQSGEPCRGGKKLKPV
jgi:transposase